MPNTRNTHCNCTERVGSNRDVASGLPLAELTRPLCSRLNNRVPARPSGGARRGPLHSAGSSHRREGRDTDARLRQHARLLQRARED